MSIKPRHRIAALVRFGENRKAAFGRLAVTGGVSPLATLPFTALGGCYGDDKIFSQQ